MSPDYKYGMNSLLRMLCHVFLLLHCYISHYFLGSVCKKYCHVSHKSLTITIPKQNEILKLLADLI